MAKTAPRGRNRQEGAARDGRQACASFCSPLETAEMLDAAGRPVSRLGGCVFLRATLKGLWSLTVTGNWRLIFRYDEQTNTASDIDLIDYH